jgi:hypothetical protein
MRIEAAVYRKNGEKMTNMHGGRELGQDRLINSERYRVGTWPCLTVPCALLEHCHAFSISYLIVIPCQLVYQSPCSVWSATMCEHSDRPWTMLVPNLVSTTVIRKLEVSLLTAHVLGTGQPRKNGGWRLLSAPRYSITRLLHERYLLTGIFFDSLSSLFSSLPHNLQAQGTMRELRKCRISNLGYYTHLPI